MRKITLLTLFIVLTSSGIIKAQYGQDTYKQYRKSYAGIKGAINFATLSTDQYNDKNRKTGWSAGVFSQIGITNFIGLQPELLYSVKGGEYDFGDDGKSKFNLKYIDLPVKLRLNLSDFFDIQFGPYVSYLVSSSLDTDSQALDDLNMSGEEDLDRDHFHSFDYGLTGGIGFNLDPLIFGVTYSHGLQKVADDDVTDQALGDSRNTMFQIYAGMRF